MFQSTGLKALHYFLTFCVASPPQLPRRTSLVHNRPHKAVEKKHSFFLDFYIQDRIFLRDDRWFIAPLALRFQLFLCIPNICSTKKAWIQCKKDAADELISTQVKSHPLYTGFGSRRI